MSWWLWLYIGVVVAFTTLIILALQRSSRGRLAGRKGAHARVTGSATDAPVLPRFRSANSGSRTANSGTNVQVLTAPAVSEPVADEPVPPEPREPDPATEHVATEPEPTAVESVMPAAPTASANVTPSPEGTPPSKWTYEADSPSGPTAHLAGVPEPEVLALEPAGPESDAAGVVVPPQPTGPSPAISRDAAPADVTPSGVASTGHASAGTVGTTSESGSAAEAEPAGTTLTATRPDRGQWPPGPYGEGSVHPPEDGSVPEGHPVKGNAGSMLFHTKESPYYGRTKAEVHFATEEHAEAAGFKAWNWRSHQG